MVSLIFNNRKCYIELLDFQLKSADKDNMLKQNQCICFPSEHVVALCWIMSIPCLLLVLPMRFIVGNSHTFGKHSFFCRHNGRIIDVLEQKCVILEMEYDKITDKEFIVNMFQEFFIELPPLKKYLDCILNKKKQRRVVHGKNDDKHRLHMALSNKLFIQRIKLLRGLISWCQT